jgi:putative transport protein
MFFKEILEAQPLITVFLILALGVLIGRIRVAGIAVGGVTGVLLVGLVVGHLGLPTPPWTDNLGFIIFIYGIGFEAGPRFIQAFRKDGFRYFILALVVGGTAATLAYGLSRFFGFELGVSAGILGGALTSTPTIVAAQDAVAQGLELPAGITNEEVLGNISSAYAITYVFGLVGLILFIGFFPRLVRLNLAEEAQKLGTDMEKDEDFESYLNRPPDLMAVRAYRAERDTAIGTGLADRDFSLPWEVQRIKRGNETFVPDLDTKLEEGDIVVLLCPEWLHGRAIERIGPEVLEHEAVDRSMESRRIVVASRELQGKTLAEMDFSGKRQVWLTEASRAGHKLPRRPDLRLQLGDVLTFTGARSKLDTLAEEMGFAEKRRWETDLLAFALGIALGMVAGLFTVQIGGVRVGLGAAGGALAAGILFGIINSYRPNLARFPAGARFILMELGLLMFMSGIGVSAGATIVETFLELGPVLAIAGAVVTLTPALLAYTIGRYVLGMNVALLFGAITGAMTSTAALRQVQTLSRSSSPALGYVGSYTFANVLLAVAGALLMRF